MHQNTEQAYCEELKCFAFANSRSPFCASHAPASSPSVLLSGIITSFSRNTLKPTTTVVRTLGDLHKAQEELEVDSLSTTSLINSQALGWRTFQGFVIPGTKPVFSPVFSLLYWSSSGTESRRRLQRAVFSHFSGHKSAFFPRFVAAVRAIEHEREDALFRDPFALALAGREAVERVKTMMKQESEEFANSTEGPCKRKTTHEQ